MSTLTIRLDPKLEKALDRLARTSGKTKSEIARDEFSANIRIACSCVAFPPNNHALIGAIANEYS